MYLNVSSITFFVCIIILEQTKCVYTQEKLARVIGGLRAKERQFPFVVAIIITEKDDYPSRCTGSVLTKKWVLTAAHCYRGIKTELVGGSKVIAGTSTSNETLPTTQVRYSKRVIVHEEDEDRGSFNFDVALIEVDQPFVLGRYVKSIRIAKLPFPVGKTLRCMSMGFGMVDDDPDVKNDNLNYMASIAHDNEFCNMKKPSLQADEEIICTEAVKQGEVTCSGDSGGPLLCQSMVVGVLSGTAGLKKVNGKVNCTDPRGVSVSMFIGYFEPWIREHIPELPASLPIIGAKVVERSLRIVNVPKSNKSVCRRITFNTGLVVILVLKYVLLFS